MIYQWHDVGQASEPVPGSPAACCAVRGARLGAPPACPAYPPPLGLCWDAATALRPRAGGPGGSRLLLRMWPALCARCRCVWTSPSAALSALPAALIPVPLEEPPFLQFLWRGQRSPLGSATVKEPQWFAVVEAQQILASAPTLTARFRVPGGFVGAESPAGWLLR